MGELDFKNRKGKFRYCNKIEHREKDFKIKISVRERVKRIRIKDKYSCVERWVRNEAQGGSSERCNNLDNNQISGLISGESATTLILARKLPLSKISQTASSTPKIVVKRTMKHSFDNANIIEANHHPEFSVNIIAVGFLLKTCNIEF